MTELARGAGWAMALTPAVGGASRLWSHTEVTPAIDETVSLCCRSLPSSLLTHLLEVEVGAAG